VCPGAAGTSARGKVGAARGASKWDRPARAARRAGGAA
jgi:hypothetical protein